MWRIVGQTYEYFGILFKKKLKTPKISLYGHFIGILSKDLYLLTIPKKIIFAHF